MPANQGRYNRIWASDVTQDQFPWWDRKQILWKRKTSRSCNDLNLILNIRVLSNVGKRGYKHMHVHIRSKHFSFMIKTLGLTQSKPTSNINSVPLSATFFSLNEPFHQMISLLSPGNLLNNSSCYKSQMAQIPNVPWESMHHLLLECLHNTLRLQARHWKSRQQQHPSSGL